MHEGQETDFEATSCNLDSCLGLSYKFDRSRDKIDWFSYFISSTVSYDISYHTSQVVMAVPFKSKLELAYTSRGK